MTKVDIDEAERYAKRIMEPGRASMGMEVLLANSLIDVVTRVRELEAIVPRKPFDVRCADALADEVDVLIHRKVIDMRSPAADALLEYRDPPRTERSDRLHCLEARVRQLEAEIGRHNRCVCCGEAVEPASSTCGDCSPNIVNYAGEAPKCLRHVKE